MDTEEQSNQSCDGISSPLLFFIILGSVVGLIAVIAIIFWICSKKSRFDVETQSLTRDVEQPQCDRSYNDKANKLKRENQDLLEKVKDLTNRLAKEMGTKVGANETNIENINIKNRPMTIADSYVKLCSNEWLDAKDVIDRVCPDNSEPEKMQLLSDIIMVVEKEMTACHNHMFEIIKYPYVHFSAETANVDVAIPAEVSNSISDFWRRNSDNMDPQLVLQHILDKLNNKYCEHECVWQKVKDEQLLHLYIRENISLAWNMVIQRPRMIFQLCDRWNAEHMEPFYGGLDPSKTPTAMSLTTVYPVLLHDTRVMTKGKVFALE